jgi:hypothetical protein
LTIFEVFSGSILPYFLVELLFETGNLTPVEDPVCAKRQRGTLLVKLITHITLLFEL